MQLKNCKWIVLLVILRLTSTMQSQYFEDSGDYFYTDADIDDDEMNFNAEAEERPDNYYSNSAIPRSILGFTEVPFAPDTTTECETEKPTTAAGPGSVVTECVPVKGSGTKTTEATSSTTDSSSGTTAAPTSTPAPEGVAGTGAGAGTSGAAGSGGNPSGNTTTSGGGIFSSDSNSGTSTSTTPPPSSTEPSTTTTSTTAAPAPAAQPTGNEPVLNNELNPKTKELHQLVQHLYIAQARVQLEATEIKKAQAVATSAQQQLEEAANHVRTITATLQTAQQEVASAAIRAQTAQLQLAAHDQLLFAARQDVDALSSQMVGIQAAEGFSQPHVSFDLGGLLERLKQPLADNEKPTPVPPLVPPPSYGKGGKSDRVAAPGQDYYYD